ncbi:MAG: plasmid stabilization protein [bacterium]|nr:MAG: plasmid stabilization protein [bacterium]
MVKKREIVWTLPARNDLQVLYDYLADISSKIAERQVDRIIQKVDILKVGFVNIGQMEPLLQDRPFEYRYLVQDNYKIIYCIREDKIVVSAVFDTRQYPGALKEKI